MEKITARLECRGQLTTTVSSQKQTLNWTLEKRMTAKLEEWEVIPSDENQIIIPNAGYAGMNKVIVKPIPSNYGKITYDGSKIIVS